MIYITGDTHADFSRFSTKRFKGQREMTKSDYIIICGDFGGIWRDRPEERYWLDWLNDKPFTTLYVDGNHENFDRYYSDEFPQVKFHGGQTHQIRDSIYHMMRGEVFELDGKRIFAFGGASSHDIRDGIVDPADYPDRKSLNRELRSRYLRWQQFRVKGVSWWPQEIPSEAEMAHGMETLASVGNKVDYVVTHCLPQEVAYLFSFGLYKSDPLMMYFNQLLHNGLQFDRWYCGHYHVDRRAMAKFDILYTDIRRIT